MLPEDPVPAPSLAWRTASTATIVATGLFAKTFLKTCAYTETRGLDRFLKLLEERRDVAKRKRGLITVSNHISVIDDPLIWGFLPLRYFFSPNNIRWSLGSHDICFKDGPKSILGTFFSLGQTLPAHRSDHSKFAGPFQPTITQCIRLLSAGPFTTPTPPHPAWAHQKLEHASDPFSDPSHVHTYSTTGEDSYPAPASFASRHHSWVHIFPEGRVHQHKEHEMRYFKWGVARLILESEPCPDIVPVFVEGVMEIMPEDRAPPRYIPELGKRVGVTFGEKVEEEVFSGFRERWKRLREKAGVHGEELNEELMTGNEAVALRIEVTSRVRKEIESLRRQRGYSDEDPKQGAAETWRLEGPKKTGRMDDGSLVGET